MLPPGCTIAVTPYSAAMATVSSNGKKPSDASTRSLSKPAALASLSAISAEPTRFICPAPTPSVRPSLTTTMAFDFTCLTILHPKFISANCPAVGFASVTHLSATTSAVWRSSSCTNRPPVTLTYCLSLRSSRLMSTCSRRRFFFVVSTSRAPSENDGAMMISKNMGFINSAASRVSSRFTATIPPKMLTLSASYALVHASLTSVPTAAPHGFMCFRPTQNGSSNSRTMQSAALAS